MTGFAFDANILIDAIGGFAPAQEEIRAAMLLDAPPSISRMAWIEVLSKGSDAVVEQAEQFLSAFRVAEIDLVTASRAADLRRERPRLKSPDAIILASAQLHGLTLVTRNTRDFPPDMPGIRIPYTL